MSKAYVGSIEGYGCLVGNSVNSNSSWSIVWCVSLGNIILGIKFSKICGVKELFDDTISGWLLGDILGWIFEIMSKLSVKSNKGNGCFVGKSVDWNALWFEGRLTAKDSGDVDNMFELKIGNFLLGLLPPKPSIASSINKNGCCVGR